MGKINVILRKRRLDVNSHLKSYFSYVKIGFKHIF